jgi:hypothetical protein
LPPSPAFLRPLLAIRSEETLRIDSAANYLEVANGVQVAVLTESDVGLFALPGRAA